MDWDHKYTTFSPSEIRDMPGGQPATLDQLFLPPDFQVRPHSRPHQPEHIRTSATRNLFAATRTRRSATATRRTHRPPCPRAARIRRRRAALTAAAQWGVGALERVYDEAEVAGRLWSASDNADGRRDDQLLCADLAEALAPPP